MLLSTPTLMDDGHTYTLVAARASHDPGTYVVYILDEEHTTVFTFCGTGDQLHGLFLGLRGVLIDAIVSNSLAVSGRAELVIPGRGDDRGASDE